MNQSKQRIIIHNINNFVTTMFSKSKALVSHESLPSFHLWYTATFSSAFSPRTQQNQDSSAVRLMPNEITAPKLLLWIHYICCNITTVTTVKIEFQSDFRYGVLYYLRNYANFFNWLMPNEYPKFSAKPKL